MPLSGNVISAVDIHTVPRPQTNCLNTRQNNESHFADYYDSLFAFCAAKATSGSSVATYQREKTGDTIHQGQTSGAEIEWNWGKKENQCNGSAEVGRGPTKDEQ